MKITHNKVGQNLNLIDTKSKMNKTENANSVGDVKTPGMSSGNLSELGKTESSKVEFSSRAQDVKKAREIAMNTPDVDEAKVARLQKLIDEKKYQVDASSIADRMVDEQLKWE